MNFYNTRNTKEYYVNADEIRRIALKKKKGEFDRRDISLFVFEFKERERERVRMCQQNVRLYKPFRNQ